MIRLEHVSKFFGSRLLLKDLSVSFAGAAIHLVTGRNGTGKSTLLRLLGGLSRPSSGEIVLEDEDAAIGYLGHATFLYPQLTALENLAFWQRAQGLAARKDELLDMLAHVDLAPFAHVRAAVFSRGMAQRLSLARVLLARPAIYLLDEPETGLDATSRDLLVREMRTARDSGACILWVSHTPVARKLADHVYELADRKLRLLGEGAQPRAAEEAPDAGNAPAAPEGDTRGGNAPC